MEEQERTTGIKELYVEGLLQCWIKGTTGSWLLIMIDIF